MQITLTIDGLDRMRGIAAIAQKLPEVCHFAAKDWMDVVFEDSQQVVPVHSGRLQASGRVEDNSDDNKVDVSIVYGSADVDYAVLIHEVEIPNTYPHPEHYWDGEHYNCGGNWHFVSTPFFGPENRDALIASLSEGIRGVFQ